jgi:drug/metabolite transporter (DMT)-like permease
MRKFMLPIILVLICVVGASAGQLLMKTGMSQSPAISNLASLLDINNLIKLFTNPYVILGLLSYGVSAILWLGAMPSLNISFMYPLMSLAYILTALGAWIFLKEGIVPTHWLGIGLIVLGCLCIGSTHG